jgi:cytosine/adenosine deaminase-related metal-dependent hydrolase
MDVLIENVAILSPEREGMLEHQNVAIKGNRIASITPEALQADAGTRRIDGRDHLLIPGLISAHAHSPENMLKGRIEAVPLEFWLFDLFGSSFAFTEREIYLAAIVGAVEMLHTGTTGVVDHFWVNGPMSESALDAVMGAYRDIGIRAGVAPLVEDDHKINDMILRQNPDLEGGVYGSSPPITAQEYLRVLDAFFQKWHLAEDGRLQCLAGPSGAQWCSTELMVGAMDIARRYGGGFHMHAEETKLQAMSCRQFFGKSAVAQLAELGLLTDRTSLAHCVWVDDHDIDLIAQAGATVVHNSVCNLKLGSGFAPVLRMVQRGTHVALASDGAASNDNQVMFDVMKVTGLMHTVRDASHHSWLKARQILSMATAGGARLFTAPGGLGTLAPGALADLTLLDMRTAAFTPLNDPFQHLVYSENGSSVRTVLVNGRVVLDNGVLQTVDEAQLLAEAREMWARRKRDIPAVGPAGRRFLEAQERYQQRVLAEPFVVDRY